jgi:hypothetical protein
MKILTDKAMLKHDASADADMYPIHKKQIRKYYLSINLDFIPCVKTIEVDDKYLSLPEKFTVFYGDLIIENASKVISKIYRISFDNKTTSGSIIVFEDNTCQYISYDDTECYTGVVLPER